MNTATAPTAAPLSLAQHKAALWADDKLFVYAVLMGSRFPDLPALLAASDVADHICLLPGALAPAARRRAPSLVTLKRTSPFTDWLLFEAAGSLGECGVVVRSASPKIGLRSHLRGLMVAATPEDQRFVLDWMDPEILPALLPLFAPLDLAAFMGPMQALVMPGKAAWTTASLVMGRLQTVTTPVARPA
jgi:hypothetical protein